jgi:hypothetical protein
MGTVNKLFQEIREGHGGKRGKCYEQQSGNKFPPVGFYVTEDQKAFPETFFVEFSLWRFVCSVGGVIVSCH